MIIYCWERIKNDNKVWYTNINQKLRNKLNGPMHYKIYVTCVFNGHNIYSAV